MTAPPRGRARIAAALLGSAIGVLTLPSASFGAIPPPPHPEFYGISPATNLDANEIALIGRGGAGTIRYPLYWPSFEPEPPSEGGGNVLFPEPPSDSKQWGPLDQLVAGAAEHGVRVMPFVYGTPGWISSDPDRPPLDDAQAREAWRDLLADLVGRYGPDGSLWAENPGLPRVPITSWQIWNEENSSLYWSPGPSAAEYADLLQLSAAAIRDADPGATVVLGGMFGTPLEGIHAWTFLEELYAVPGIADHFDAYALHPYSPHLKGFKAQIGLARKAVKRAGDRRLPLLLTEIGWPTDGPADYRFVKSLRGQKRMLAKAFRAVLGKRRRWKVRQVVWYTWRDNRTQPDCTICSHSGLLDRDLRPKPAWRKFAQFAGGKP